MPKPSTKTSVSVPRINQVYKDAEFLSLREWWCHVGSENFHKVVVEVGTSELYLRHIAYRYRLPSYRFVKALIAAAQVHTPGFAPNLERMLEPLTPRGGPRGVRGPRIRPSAQFVDHQLYLQAIGRDTGDAAMLTHLEAIASGNTAQAMGPEEGDALLARLERAEQEHKAVRALLTARRAARSAAKAATKLERAA